MHVGYVGMYILKRMKTNDKYENYDLWQSYQLASEPKINYNKRLLSLHDIVQQDENIIFDNIFVMLVLTTAWVVYYISSFLKLMTVYSICLGNSQC